MAAESSGRGRGRGRGRTVGRSRFAPADGSPSGSATGGARARGRGRSSGRSPLSSETWSGGDMPTWMRPNTRRNAQMHEAVKAGKVLRASGQAATSSLGSEQSHQSSLGQQQAQAGIHHGASAEPLSQQEQHHCQEAPQTVPGGGQSYQSTVVPEQPAAGLLTADQHSQPHQTRPAPAGPLAADAAPASPEPARPGHAATSAGTHSISVVPSSSAPEQAPCSSQPCTGPLLQQLQMAQEEQEIGAKQISWSQPTQMAASVSTGTPSCGDRLPSRVIDDNRALPQECSNGPGAILPAASDSMAECHGTSARVPGQAQQESAQGLAEPTYPAPSGGNSAPSVRAAGVSGHPGPVQPPPAATSHGQDSQPPRQLGANEQAGPCHATAGAATSLEGSGISRELRVNPAQTSSQDAIRRRFHEALAQTGPAMNGKAYPPGLSISWQRFAQWTSGMTRLMSSMGTDILESYCIEAGSYRNR